MNTKEKKEFNVQFWRFLFSLYAEGWIWYGFLTAYIIEMVAIFVLHKMTHVKFELTDNKQ